MKKRILAVILTLAMLMGACPLESLAYAQEAIATAFAKTVEDNPNAQETVNDEVFIIGEDESRRDETTKHYILSNGNTGDWEHRGRFCVLTSCLLFGIIFKGESDAKTCETKKRKRNLSCNVARS